MYKVFVNDKCIILTDKLTKENINDIYLLKSVDLELVIDKLLSGKLDKVLLYYKQADSFLKALSKKIPIVEAAGGLVRNTAGKVLFIYRNGKWDLPKGKTEKGENIEETAVREVMEETGVQNIIIGDFLRKTYHVFKRNGVYKLKLTYWYEMQTDYKGPLVPQFEEDIMDVCWKTTTETQEALQNSYENIKLLFQD